MGSRHGGGKHEILTREQGGSHFIFSWRFSYKLLAEPATPGWKKTTQHILMSFPHHTPDGVNFPLASLVQTSLHLTAVAIHGKEESWACSPAEEHCPQRQPSQGAQVQAPHRLMITHRSPCPPSISSEDKAEPTGGLADGSQPWQSVWWLGRLSFKADTRLQLWVNVSDSSVDDYDEAQRGCTTCLAQMVSACNPRDPDLILGQEGQEKGMKPIPVCCTENP